MKIATFADIHIGVTTYGEVDSETGLNSRILNALQSMKQMIDYCIKNKIEYIIGAGDMYKNSTPSPTLKDEFDKLIKYGIDNNIKFLLMDGNHDVSPNPQNKSALEGFNTLDVPGVASSRFGRTEYLNIDGINYKLIFLPTYCTQDEVEKILDIEYKGDIPTLVIGHFTIRGAHLNDWLIEDKEENIDMNIFLKPNIKAVIMGHLHKHQILNTDPLIYYTGSLQRIDFTEEKQQKGFVVLDINDDIKYEFIEVKSQKFCTLKIDLTKKDAADNIAPMNVILNKINLFKNKIDDSITRIIIKLTKDIILDDKEILDCINKYNPKYLIGLQKIYEDEKKIRNVKLTEDLSTEKALEIFFKDYEYKKEILRLSNEIMNEVKNNPKYSSKF